MTKRRNMERRASERGFTLLEVLIYTGITAIIGIVLTSAVLMLLRGRATAIAQASLHDALRFAEARIATDIRSADAVAVPATAGAFGPTLELSVGGQTVRYGAEDGALMRSVDGQVGERLTPEGVTVVPPNFTRYENANPALAEPIITVRMTLAASGASGEGSRATETLMTTIRLP